MLRDTSHQARWVQSIGQIGGIAGTDMKGLQPAFLDKLGILYIQRVFHHHFSLNLTEKNYQ